MLRGYASYKNVEVDFFEGLLVGHAGARGATLIIAGFAISDYEYEWQMALMNRRLRPEIETMFRRLEKPIRSLVLTW